MVCFSGSENAGSQPESRLQDAQPATAYRNHTLARLQPKLVGLASKIMDFKNLGKTYDPALMDSQKAIGRKTLLKLVQRVVGGIDRIGRNDFDTLLSGCRCDYIVYINKTDGIVQSDRQSLQRRNGDGSPLRQRQGITRVACSQTR